MLDVTFDEFERLLLDEVCRRLGVAPQVGDGLGQAPTQYLYDTGYSIPEAADVVMEFMGREAGEI